MWSFALLFWLLPLLFFCAAARHRRRAHWSARQQELDDYREYVERLERRVVDLEDRLDFTERLLAQRNQPAPGPV